MRRLYYCRRRKTNQRRAHGYKHQHQTMRRHEARYSVNQAGRKVRNRWMILPSAPPLKKMSAPTLYADKVEPDIVCPQPNCSPSSLVLCERRSPARQRNLVRKFAQRGSQKAPPSQGRLNRRSHRQRHQSWLPRAGRRPMSGSNPPHSRRHGVARRVSYKLAGRLSSAASHVSAQRTAPKRARMRDDNEPQVSVQVPLQLAVSGCGKVEKE